MTTEAAGTPMRKFRLAVLISGGGTTLKNLIDRIDRGMLDAEIAVVISSTPKAGGLAFAAEAGIDRHVVDHSKYQNAEEFSRDIFDICRQAGVDLVVMGGFLKQVVVPDDFVHRVVNIHPALIPAFCGKGFYGRRVHAAAIEYGVKISGCTIHFVDNQYDHGPVIMQRAVPVLDDDTPESLAARVFAAECEAYPEAIALIATGRVAVHGRLVRVLAASGEGEQKANRPVR